MAPPRVSICIPTWNGAAFLGEALQSAVAQTYEDFELRESAAEQAKTLSYVYALMAVDVMNTEAQWKPTTPLRRWAGDWIHYLLIDPDNSCGMHECMN